MPAPSPFPLPAGSKNMIRRNESEMVPILKELLSAPDGIMATTNIHEQTGISADHIQGHLRKLKSYGIVTNAHKPGNNCMAKNWWIVPAIRHNLSSFLTLEY